MQHRQHFGLSLGLLLLFLLGLQYVVAVDSEAGWRLKGRQYGENINKIKRQATTTTATTPATPSPIQPGQVSGCIGWRYVQASDTCDNIVTRYSAAPVSLTKANLLAWNPALKSDCTGLIPKNYVCVQRAAAVSTTSSRTTSRTTTTTSVSSPATPSPVQSGQVGGCIGWRYVQATDTCDNIVSRYTAAPVSLSKPNLLSWNRALKSDCSGLTKQYYICVQRGAVLTTTTRTSTTSSRTATTSSRATTTSSRAPPTTTSTRTSTTSTATSVSGLTTPLPVQSGQASGCVGWRYVQSSDTCDNIVNRFAAAPVSLTKPNFLAWNPALKSDCSGLAPKFFVCVQRSVVATTTSRSTTRPSTTTATTTISTRISTARCKGVKPTGEPLLALPYNEPYEDIPPSFVGYINGYNQSASLTGISMNVTSNSTGRAYKVLFDIQNSDYIAAILEDGTNIALHDDPTVSWRQTQLCGAQTKRDVSTVEKRAEPDWIEPPRFAVKVSVHDRCGEPVSGLRPILACTYDPNQYLGGLIQLTANSQYLNEQDYAVYSGMCKFPRIANRANNYGCVAIGASKLVERCEAIRKWKNAERISCVIASIPQPEFLPICLEAIEALLKFCGGVGKLKKVDDTTHGALSKAFCSPPPEVINMDVGVSGFYSGDGALALAVVGWNVYTGQAAEEVDLHATLSVLPSQPCPTSTSRSSTRTSTTRATTTASRTTTRPSVTFSVSATIPTYERPIPTQETGPFAGMPLCIPPPIQVDFTSLQYSGCGWNATGDGSYYCDHHYDDWISIDSSNGPPQGTWTRRLTTNPQPPFPGVVTTFWEYNAVPPFPAYGSYWTCGIKMQCPTPGCGEFGMDTVTSQVTLGYSRDFNLKVKGTWPSPWPIPIVQPCDGKNCPARCAFGTVLDLRTMECVE